jgi:Icc protein
MKQINSMSKNVQPGSLRVRAKFWGDVEAKKASATLDGDAVPMERVQYSHGIQSLLVSVEDEHGDIATDEIRVAIGDRAERERAERDQDNTLEAWPEHGLLGTQLGPNKNGKKW